MSTKTIKTTGWVLTATLSALFALSAFLKLTQNEAALAQAASMGFQPDTYQLIGVVEIIAVILFILPRTGIAGTLLLIAYMGGAIASHLAHQQPVAMALAVQALLWITAVLRFPELTKRIFPAVEKA